MQNNSRINEIPTNLWQKLEDVMKLLCNVSINNRLHSTFSIKSTKKSTKSTVALCKHPKSEKYCMILFTGQDKNGTKYELKNNIEKILTKFINEGKSTIQFKNPPHDLFLQADVVALKSFLHLLKRILTGNIAPNEMTCSSLSVTPFTPKDIAPTKLIIQSRSEYPSKGFPRTLEFLTITGINRSSLDIGILRLTRLKVLDLSNNSISKLPEEFSKMLNLQVLNLSNNQLYKSTKYDWKWLNGTLSKTLQSLDLCKNNLEYIPEHIVKFRNLNILHVSDNMLKELPSGIGHLPKLKELKASRNKMKALPGSIVKLRLRHIEICDNDFDSEPQILNPISPKILPPCTLKEIAAQRVLNLRLHYDASIIPATVVNFLDYDAKYCVCGKSCFSVYMRGYSIVRLRSIAETIICYGNFIDENEGLLSYFAADCYFCSLACTKIWPIKRAPLVR